MRRADHLLLIGGPVMAGCREPQSPTMVTTVLGAPPEGHDGFAAGDYITLAASQGRLAAAYVSVLPEPPAR